MPGIAAILAAPGVPTEWGIHMYYSTNAGTVALQLHDKNKSGQTGENFTCTNDEREGNVVKTSPLAATTMMGVPIVLALTYTKAAAPGSGEGQTYNLSIAAPFQKKLVEVSRENLGFATCSSSTTTWVYYFTGVDANSLQINEMLPTSENSGPYDSTAKILVGSSLAAYYVKPEMCRFVIYQCHADKLLYEFTQGSQEDSDVFDEDNKVEVSIGPSNAAILCTTDAKARTPLAAVHAGNKVYLYYINSNSNRLTFAAKTHGKWSNSELVTSAVAPLDDLSQIAVIGGANFNDIFYKSKNGAFIHVKHKHVKE